MFLGFVNEIPLQNANTVTPQLYLWCYETQRRILLSLCIITSIEKRSSHFLVLYRKDSLCFGKMMRFEDFRLKCSCYTLYLLVTFFLSRILTVFGSPKATLWIEECEERTKREKGRKQGYLSAPNLRCGDTIDRREFILLGSTCKKPRTSSDSLWSPHTSR